MKKLAFIIFLCVGYTLSTQAQIEEVFAAAKADAQTYTENYMAPALNGLMYNLNNGWYTTGKTHNLFGFDITFSVSGSRISDEEKVFHFVASDYNTLKVDSGDTKLPTVAGGDSNSVLEVTHEGNSFTFNAIDGIGSELSKKFFFPTSVLSPMVQIGFGLPKKTDIKLRFFPKLKFGDADNFSFSMFGVGLQHNLLQYFKVVDKLPILNVSGLAGFTRVNVNYTPNAKHVSGENQSMEMRVNAFTVQVIGDVNLKIVNFYLGMGYTGGKTKLEALGTYEFDFSGNNVKIENPVALDFGVSGFKTTLGARFNLGPIKLFADYSIQKYPSFTAGLAVSIR